MINQQVFPRAPQPSNPTQSLTIFIAIFGVNILVYTFLICGSSLSGLLEEKIILNLLAYSVALSTWFIGAEAVMKMDTTHGLAKQAGVIGIIFMVIFILSTQYTYFVGLSTCN